MALLTLQERLAPISEGPPCLDERQVTPGHLLDMQLGYLSNMGAEVELVGTTSGRVTPVTIVAVDRSYWLGQRPDGSRLVTQEEIDTGPDWTDCDYVTFYTASEADGDTTHYEYERIGYTDLGLAPVRDQSYTPTGWEREPIWHLRWPAE